MATTDNMCAVQRPLAEFAWTLKVKYGLTLGVTREQFMNQYDAQEVQLSSVFENIFVAVRGALGKPVTRVSADGYDFSNLGDMKTGVLQKDGDSRRFVIKSVSNKLGTIYFVGWNWITEKPCFFAIPSSSYEQYESKTIKKKVKGKWQTYTEKVRIPLSETFHPRAGYKILVHPITGERTGGYYNLRCAYDSFEDMAAQD